MAGNARSGRRPQPTRLKILRGNPSKTRLSEDEPQPTVLTDAAPPDWLNEEAKAEWRRLAPMLERLGVLTETDVEALTAFCSAWAMWKEATQHIAKWGMVIKAPEAEIPVVSPYVKIANKTLGDMRAFLLEFGMTPSSRTKIHAKPSAAPPVSKWAGLK